MIKDICPNCEKITALEFIHSHTTIHVRGEPILVEDQYFHCLECNQTFEHPQSTHDVLELAYREYRLHHGMLQPEEIRAWRKHYGLTQKELSGLLAWGAVTLSRYEQGKLQDEAHEKVLRLAMDTHNLIKLIQNSNQVIHEEKRSKLITELTSELQQEHSFEQFYEEQFGNYQPDQFSGYQRLNIEKLLACIRFFCYEAGQFVTKINKLLFYADFKHFKENALSITGARYARINYGPVPDKYEFYMASLKENKEVSIEEIFYRDMPVEKIVSVSKPDLSLFSDSEIQILIEVKKYFKDFSAKKISHFSHEEEGYIKTKNTSFISYLFAKELQI